MADEETVNPSRYGTIPQWFTAILLAVLAWGAIKAYDHYTRDLDILKLEGAESRRRIELLEQRYELTDQERREAIKELRAANQLMVLELKNINAQLAKLIDK